jgi:hypothetical protein
MWGVGTCRRVGVLEKPDEGLLVVLVSICRARPWMLCPIGHEQHSPKKPTRPYAHTPIRCHVSLASSADLKDRAGGVRSGV